MGRQTSQAQGDEATCSESGLKAESRLSSDPQGTTRAAIPHDRPAGSASLGGCVALVKV